MRLYDVESGELIKAVPVGTARPVSSVAFSPDSRWIATASVESGPQLWDAGNGDQIGEPTPHSGVAYSVAVSAHGELIATGSEGGAVRVWDRVSRTEKFVAIQP